MYSILPQAEKEIRDHLNDLSVDEVRNKLNSGYFGSDGSPKYKFVQRYLKEELRKIEQEKITLSSLNLQAEANNIARMAIKKATAANYLSIAAIILSLVTFICSVMYKII